MSVRKSRRELSLESSISVYWLIGLLYFQRSSRLKRLLLYGWRVCECVRVHVSGETALNRIQAYNPDRTSNNFSFL